ncbi:hypothetical protein FQZ97_1151110 [compost metagenome]
MVLEHHGALGAGFVDLTAVEDDPAGGGLVQAGDDVQNGGFAAAGVADQGDELALVDAQVDVLQRAVKALVGGEVDADAGQFEV